MSDLSQSSQISETQSSPQQPPMPSQQQQPSQPLSQAQEMLLIWKDNPKQFVMDMFGVTPEPWQTAAMEAIRDHDRVTIRSGHGVGKSAMLSWTIPWWLMTRYPAKIACTAPTAHQLHDILWAELGTWLRRMPEAFRSQFQIKQGSVHMQGAVDHFAVARTSRPEQPEALQGFHSPNMLFLVDEASGVEDIIFEVGEGSLSTEGAKIVMTGNPTRLSGYFHRSHQSGSSWVRMQVPCDASSMVRQSFINEMKEAYGEESNVYRVRVLGEFPLDDGESYFPYELVANSIGRDIQMSDDFPTIWGFDVARFGKDRSALCKRKGPIVLEPIQTWKDRDLMSLVGILKAEYDALTPSQQPVAINVDVIGLGAGVVDRAREIGLPVFGVNVSESAALNLGCLRLRDEVYLKARKWFEGLDVSLPDDQDLLAELTAIQFDFTSAGKLQIESKDKMAKRGLPSPDLAEAFVLTFGREGFKAQRGSSGRIRHKKLQNKIARSMV